MNEAFDCAECGHRVSHHTVSRWMQTAKACSRCDCDRYQPKYRTQGEK